MLKRAVCIALLFLLFTASAGYASAKPRAVLVIAGSCSVRDFSKMLDGYSAGLLNVRPGRTCRDLEPGSASGFESGCLSLGASAMATGGAETRRAGNSASIINNCSVGDAFFYRTGIRPGSAAVLHPEIALIQRANELASYRAKPGALGSALRKAGVRTAIIGCSDIPGEIHHEAVAAAMDEDGIVDYGDVEGAKLLKTDNSAPYGVRTDPSSLLRAFDDMPIDCRFVVIDYGDTFRADAYSELCTDRQAAIAKSDANARLSAFVGELKKRLDKKSDLLIVLSPNSRSFTEIEDERLGAILISGPGFCEGVLTSPSTQVSGVATLGDVGPTILNFMGIEPSADMVGRPIRSMPNRDVAGSLIALNKEASAQAQRQQIMRWGSVTQSVIVVIVLATIFLAASPATKKFAGWFVLAFAAIPLAMLAMPLVFSLGLVESTAALVAIVVVIIGFCALAFRSPTRAFVWLCAANVVLLMVDLTHGAPLIRASIAGYNIVEGARYYGIGNEFMGTMLGASIVGLGLALASGRFCKRVAGVVAVLVLGATFVFIGAPFLGANIGGALASAPAICVMLLVLRGWRLSVRGIVLIGLITVLLVVGLFTADALRGSATQSHAGKTMAMLTGEGTNGLLWVIERKLALNFMLVVTSVWSRLLGLCLAGSAVLWGVGRRKFGADFIVREESAAALGCLVGTLGAFIFNDSGVVAGATCSVFLFAMLVLKMIERAKGRA